MILNYLNSKTFNVELLSLYLEEDKKNRGWSMNRDTSYFVTAKISRKTKENKIRGESRRKRSHLEISMYNLPNCSKQMAELSLIGLV